jgi:hypothetical protein
MSRLMYHKAGGAVLSPILTGLLYGAGGAAKGIGGAIAGGARLTGAALDALLQYGPYVAFGIPAGLGMAAGAASSRLTGPSSSELKADEENLSNAVMESMIAEHRRKRQQQERLMRRGTQ